MAAHNRVQNLQRLAALNTRRRRSGDFAYETLTQLAKHYRREALLRLQAQHG